MFDAQKKFEKSMELLTKYDDIINLRRKKFNSYNEARECVKKEFNTYDLEKEVLEIKKRSLANIDALIDKAIKKMEKNHINVFYAKTAEDARKYALDVIADDKIVVHASTDLITEIGLKDELLRRGVDIVHSEMAYHIAELIDDLVIFDKPTPITHVPLNVITKALKEKLGIDVPEDPEAIVMAVRKELLEKIERARVGISGANSISAADGTVFTCFGNGNIAHMALRPVYMVFAGIEKIVPTLPDAFKVTYLQSLYEGGIGGAAYYLGVHGPSDVGPIGGMSIHPALGSKEVHVVLLDNGRKNALSEGFDEVLRCIRCFTCHHYCPVYQVLGPGYGYGFKIAGYGYKGYIGGRGVILTAFVYGLDKAIEGGLYACAMCGSCYEHCPMEINVPEMISRLRHKAYLMELSSSK